MLLILETNLYDIFIRKGDIHHRLIKQNELHIVDSRAR
jgi:hypothetical protein